MYHLDSGGMLVKRGRTMLLNTLLLTATTFLMRSVGVLFQVYLSNKIGAAGIGLFQLIMSVSMLAAAFAISGIRFATTRLVSEELGLGKPGGVKRAVFRCLLYGLSFGSAAMLLLFFGAGFIGTVWVGDERSVLSLKILALSLPAFAMSNVLSGYFTAVSRVVKSAGVHVAEQAIRITVIVLALSRVDVTNVEGACAAVVIGGVVGEIGSFFLMFAVYRLDRRRYDVQSGKRSGLTRRMFSIALPLAFSAYARTALVTLENLLIPRGLRKSGATSEQALADFGMIEGMVVPIITFPAALFYALSELLVPELTDAQVTGNKARITSITSRTLYLCLLFSVGVMAIMFYFSGELGMAIYDSESVGEYLRLLSVLIPLIYLDTVTDGMLRGLGEHLYTMRINIFDSLISVLLIYVLLPRYAVMGYVVIIYFTEVFNFAFSLYRLVKKTKLRLPLLRIVKSVAAAIGAVNGAVLLLRLLGFSLMPETLSLAVHILLSAVGYFVLLFVLNCLDKNDIKWFKDQLR